MADCGKDQHREWKMGWGWRNGMVIVASQRLETERPWSSSGEQIRDGEEFAEGSNRQGKGRVSLLPWSLVTQASAPSMQETFINLQKLRGHFHGIVFAMDQRPTAG